MTDNFRIDSGATSQSGDSIPLQESESTKEVVGRGFADTNSVSHQMPQPGAAGPTGRKIVLPLPRLTAAETTPRILREVDDSLKNINPYDGLGDLFSERQDVLANAIKLKTANPANQDVPPVGEISQKDILRFQAIDPKNVEALSETALDIMARVGAIESAPKELLDDIKATSAKALNAVLTGNVEDAAQWLIEVQTKLQDNRIKFDSEAIQANKQRQKQIHETRIDSLHKQMEKMQKAEKMRPLIKALTIVFLAATYVTAIVTIITPGAQVAGAMLFAAAALMTASMVISETKAIKNDKAALAVSISLTVLAAILSLGAGIATTAGSGASTIATQTAKTAADATAKTVAKEAAKAAVKEAAKGSADDVIKAAAQEASKKAAERIARETAEAAVTEGMKPMAREILFKSTQRAAEEAAKKVTASVVKEATKNATKNALRNASQQQIQTVTNNIANTAAKSVGKKAINSIAKSAAQEATREVKMGALYKVGSYARYSGQFIQGATMTTQGGLEGYSTVVKKQGADFGADAKEDLARMAALQFFMETLMENIRKIYEELTSGQEIASSTLKSALDTKSSIISHI